VSSPSRDGRAERHRASERRRRAAISGEIQFLDVEKPTCKFVKFKLSCK
jgi:hypothetical protein